MSHSQIGLLHHETGRPAEGLESLERAIAILDRLARENPSVTEYQSDLARTHRNLSLVQRDTGRLSSARFSSACPRSLRAAGGENPAVTKFQSDLAASHISIGILQRTMGRPAEAMASYEQAPRDR